MHDRAIHSRSPTQPPPPSARAAGSVLKLSISGPVLTYKRLLIVILLIGSLLRLWGLERPLEHRLANAWRSSDYIQIARNFTREGLNPFYPRIDWRGDTPGFVEMEFPLLPWLAALCDRMFGHLEVAMRLLAAAFSIGALVLFFRMARAVIPPAGALMATAAFALNPLLVKLGNALQPEPVMIFFAVLFILRVLEWQRRPTSANLLIASACLMAASLAKPPCAILGLVLLLMVLRNCGMRSFLAPINYVAAFMAAAPVVAWVVWSRHFWTLYGNSLGVSNESHWLTWALLWPPIFLLGNLRWETLAVWTPLGWLLGAFAWKARSHELSVAWLWLLAVYVFYFIAGGTSGDDWASYYHCASVPPACLLMGAGASFLLSTDRKTTRLFSSPARGQAIAIWLSGGVLLSLAVASAVAVYRRDHHEELLRMRQCAIELARIVPPDGRIVVRGGDKFDKFGSPVAHNEPMMFAWMDRKGFNYARSDLSAKTLHEIGARGGQYWIVRSDELHRVAIHADVDRMFTHMATCACGDYSVYDLRSAPHSMGQQSDGETRAISP